MPILEQCPHKRNEKKDMTTKGKPTQQGSVLSDVVHCSYCGATMIVSKARYVCPNHNQARGADCSTTSVDAERLAHQLIATLVERVMTPDTVADLVERIQNDAADKLRTQRDKLDNTESTIEELNSQKQDILVKVEYRQLPYADVVNQLETIEATTAGLAYESTISQTEIEKWEFVSNQEAIQSAAQDVATYTKFADPGLAKQLVNTFIKDIRVCATSSTVTYNHPIPGERNEELITSESFPLP